MRMQAHGRGKKTEGFQLETDDSSDIEEVHHTPFEAGRAKARREKEREERNQGRGRSRSFRMWSMADDLPTLPQNNPAAGTPSPAKPTKEKFGMETDPVQVKRGRYSWEPDASFRSAKRHKTTHTTEEDAQKEYLRRVRRMRTPTSRHARGSAQPRARATDRDFWQDVNFSQFKGVQFTVDQEPEAGEQSRYKEEETPQQGTYSQSSDRRSPPIIVDSGDEDDMEQNEASGRWSDPEDSEDERERRLYESRKKMEELNHLEQRGKEERQRREREYNIRMEELRRQEELRRAEEQRRSEKERQRRQRAEEEEQRRKKAEKENRRRDDPFGGSWHQTNAPWSETYRSTGPDRAGGINFEWFNGFSSNPFGSRGSSFRSYRPTPASAGPSNGWTSQKALDRYNKLSEAFDTFKPTADAPLPAEDQIPWPVLGPKYDLNQINWKSVEKFFEEAERLMGGRGAGKEKWKEFLKTSTTRFHPDRWRARGFIGDKGFGIDVEEVVNHVSKVLTPLYRNAN